MSAGAGRKTPPGGDKRERSAADKPLSVSALASLIDGALRDGLPARVRVVGEITNLRERTHFYFDLADQGAVVNAVFFASAARKSRAVLSIGAEVVATGRVDFYAPSGRVSLIVERVEPVGIGAGEKAMRALLAELRALGWFDPEHKRTLPSFPRRIAVVTSRTGAALQDVIDTVRRRCPAVGLLVVDARVQGEAAVGEVTGAIRALSAAHERLGVEAIIVTRGGGSADDLAAFNDRDIAKAIHECPIPVVAAIGHETDQTIAELVADERCATPTQAAMRLTPDRAALGEQVETVRRRMARTLKDRASFERRRLASLSRRPVILDPAEIVSQRRGALEWIGGRLTHTTRDRLGRAVRSLERLGARLERGRPSVVHARRSERLRALHARLERAVRVSKDREVEHTDALERELHAVGPMAVLARGFSATLDERGRLVRSVDDVTPGQPLLTRLADGSVRSVVEGSGHENRAPAPPPPPRRRTRSRPRRDDQGRDQMDLFAGGG